MHSAEFKTTIRQLSYLNTAILLVLAVISLLLDDHLWGIPAAVYFIAYASLTLAFWAGSLWGKAIYHRETRHPVLLARYAIGFMIVSLLPLLLAYRSPGLAILLSAGLYVGQWFIEYRAYHDIEELSGYRMIRWQVTTVALIAHCIALLG